MTKIKEPEGGWQKTIRMPKKLWKKWDKAVRSGTYKQTRKGTMYNHDTAGFCCLGVLQHCVTGGEVECEGESGDYCELPTKKWLKDSSITFKNWYGVHREDPWLGSLDGCHASGADDGGKKFTTIADAIARHVEFTD